ncbi:MAG TPA: ADP-ribosylglycohydrolase family protein [Thermosynechococcaceae cyanobacterium]
MRTEELHRFRGCLLGLAVGDAVGTTVEFRSRGTFSPVTDMVGGGPFRLAPGQWTDDTSMALALATSLLTIGGFDAADQMNRYCDWYDRGSLSSTGTCFDIGNTVRQALERYKASQDPFSGSTAANTAGNGSLMRLAPVPMFYFPDRDRALHFAAESSRTTHGAVECVEACQLFAEMLLQALAGGDKSDVLFANEVETSAPAIQAIAQGAYRKKAIDEIRGTGYVVESLEAALWCFWTTDTFEQAILTAANLGDDADTTAAICGQVAGAFYGETGIPDQWLQQLYWREQITAIADQLGVADPA